MPRNNILIILLLAVAIAASPVNAYVAGFSPTIDGQTARAVENMTMAQVVGAGTTVNTAATTMTAQLATFPGTETNKFHQGFKIIWSADTSPIPDGATITDARFNYTIFINQSTLKPFYLTITNGSLTNDGAIVAGDYALNGSTEYISRVIWSDPNLASGTTQRSVQFNAAGLAGINKTGNTTLFIQISDFHDTAFTGVWATAPVVGANNTIIMRSNDHATPAYRPVLNITYTLPTTTVYPLRFINDTRILPNSDTGLPPAGVNLTINATPGEITQGSFVIKAPSDITDMSVNASTLTNETGGTISTAALNITTVKAWWQTGNNATVGNLVLSALGSSWVLTPELLLKNDSIIRTDLTAQTTEIWVENVSAAPFSGYKHIDNTSIGQWLPDYKIFDNASANGMPIPFALDNTRNKQIMVKAWVPAGTPHGNYTGNLWVNSSNSEPKKMNLTVRVLPFVLPNNTMMHGVYNSGTLDSSITDKRYVVTQANYTAMLRSLKEHNLLYTPVEIGTTGWGATTETMADLRDTLDFPKDAVFMRGYNYVLYNIAANITEATMADHVTEIQTSYTGFNGTHGIVDLYVYAGDEMTQAQQPYMRPVYENITANNGKVFSATNVNISYFGDTLSAPVSTAAGDYPFTPPTGLDGTWLNLSTRNDTHFYKGKAFAYLNPEISIEYPETYRKHYGLALTKWGFDGSMIFQWIRYQDSTADPDGLHNTTWNEYRNNTGKISIGRKPGGWVYPKFDGYVDTLSYEGMREGTNDQRYAQYLTELTGSNRTALDTIAAGITNKQDMQEIRYNLTGLILTELIPEAAFTAYPTLGTEPVSVAFTDTSGDSPTSWRWAYKNATTDWTTFSTAQNPTYTFPAGGYDINLTATNDAGSDDEIKASYLSFAPSEGTETDPLSHLWLWLHRIRHGLGFHLLDYLIGCWEVPAYGI